MQNKKKTTKKNAKKKVPVKHKNVSIKPIEKDELLLRISALLRRAKIANDKKVTVGSMTLNELETSVFIDSEEIQLTTKEFQILCNTLACYVLHYTVANFDSTDFNWHIGLMTIIFTNKL